METNIFYIFGQVGLKTVRDDNALTAMYISRLIWLDTLLR